MKETVILRKSIRSKKRLPAKTALKIFDAKKFSGKLKIKEDPLALQKQWRNEQH